MAQGGDGRGGGVHVEVLRRRHEMPPRPRGLVAALRHEITAADGLLFATPEYNATNPGQRRTPSDRASCPFPANALRGKPAAVIGASTGIFGAVWAQAELRKVLRPQAPTSSTANSLSPMPPRPSTPKGASTTLSAPTSER